MSDDATPLDPPDAAEPGDPEPAPIGVLGGRSRRGRRRRTPSRRGRLFLVLAVLALPFVIAAAWFWYQLDPFGDPGAPVAVTIPKGEGVSGIADRLARSGVIGSSLAFSIYARLSGSEQFEAGRYRMRQDLGVRAAVDVLERGPTQHYTTLALPPGLTFAEVAARIGALPNRDAATVTELATTGAVRSRYEPQGTNSLEGLTWPDSYSVEDHETEADILRTIVRAFDKHATQLGLADSPDPYRTVTVASLIQREAGVDEDRPLIAGVVENRLREDMPLQIDATVLYARGGGSGPLTDEDFARDSPYNTYVVKGLPPTPISTVTAASLTAALHPADVPYLYYVLTDTNGKHAFAETYAEHQANIADARRRGVIKWITGATRLAAVIGAPVRHSRSPAIHNAAFEATGLDWVYVALPVQPGRGGDAVRAAAVLGLGGLSVTMPHKADAADACDELTPTAAALQSVNTVVVHDDGTTRGDSTDGEGFLRSIAAEGLDPTGRDVLVLGAGGAARAVAGALVGAGASVRIAARRDAARDALVAAVDGTVAAEWPAGGPAVAEVVVNATPIGMAGDPGLPVEPVAGQWVVDLVYHPLETPLLRRAESVGARTVGGLGMLVHQAALAFEQWTGVAAPLDAMWAAATTS